MLILSRAQGQTIVIGDNTTVTVKKICGQRVVLAIAAPRETKIRRGELAQKHVK